MPLYEFECGTCRKRTLDLAAVGTGEIQCPLCLKRGTESTARKVVSKPAIMRLAPHLQADAEALNAGQRKWIESPECQAKLKSGEWEIRGHTKGIDNEGPPGAPSVDELLREAERERCLDRCLEGKYQSETEFFNMAEVALEKSDIELHAE